MSRSTVRNQLLLNDGLGNKLPIQTGIWTSQAVNIDEHRRLSISIGVGSTTGIGLGNPWAGDGGGGFTGILLIQGTNELAQSNGVTGTQEAGNTSRPGTNQFTGAALWNTIPSGSYNITAGTHSLQIDVSDVGCAFVRLNFNNGIAAPIGSGTMYVFLTAKNT